jgi:inhibitor of KinA sporulation pathway (predicted exonuclease)
MRHRRFWQMYEGDGPRGFSAWVRPDMRKFLTACCGCDLVHETQFRIVDGAVEFRAKECPRYTAAQRKKRKRKA